MRESCASQFIMLIGMTDDVDGEWIEAHHPKIPVPHTEFPVPGRLNSLFPFAVLRSDSPINAVRADAFCGSAKP
jgi:hypothetical protein